MKYLLYEEYKNSGIEWFGDIPNHWKSMEAKFAYRIQLGKMLQPNSDSDDDIELPYLKALHVQWENISSEELPNMWASLKESEKYSVRIGDLLVCEGGEVGRSAMLGNCPENTIIQNALHRVRSLSDNANKFLMYLLEAANSQDWFNILCNRSTIAHFTSEKFGAMKIGLPPTEEQKDIVNYLDKQTAKIDTLIAKKREIIKRFKEKRTALISRAVTRGLPPDAAKATGLNPNPKLKPSGINWLGDIPEHWEALKFSREIYITEGQVDPEDEVYSSMILIAPNHITKNMGQLLEKETASEQGAISGKYFCKAGEVIYSKIRPALRKLCIAPEDCLCSADMYPLSGRKKLMNLYIYWLFLSEGFLNWSVLESDRVAMPKINRETLNELRIPVPPLNEQKVIIDFLNHEISKIDKLTTKVKSAINKLQEYRSALITAAVTGKIDVRKEAA